MTQRNVVLALAPSLLLAACGGGGGGGVASAPPPPSVPPPVRITSTSVVKTPLPASDYAGLAPGTFAAIAIAVDTAEAPERVDPGPQTVRMLAPGDVRLIADPAKRTYTLEIGLAGYPASQVFDFGHVDRGRLGKAEAVFGNHVVQTDTFSDGTSQTSEYDATSHSSGTPIVDTSATTAESHSLYYTLGQRYVSWWIWNHTFWTKMGATSYQSSIWHKSRAIAFVAGRTTEPGELPLTGTANYTLIVNDGGYFGGYQGRLSADFASREVEAAFLVNADPGSDFSPSVIGLSATGKAIFGPSGDYVIALSGTSNEFFEAPAPVEGTMRGAFFGPAAEETGGVLDFLRAGKLLHAGSYAGRRDQGP